MLAKTVLQLARQKDRSPAGRGDNGVAQARPVGEDIRPHMSNRAVSKNGECEIVLGVAPEQRSRVTEVTVSPR